MHVLLNEREIRISQEQSEGRISRPFRFLSWHTDQWWACWRLFDARISDRCSTPNIKGTTRHRERTQQFTTLTQSRNSLTSKLPLFAIRLHFRGIRNFRHFRRGTCTHGPQIHVGHRERTKIKCFAALHNLYAPQDSWYKVARDSLCFRSTCSCVNVAFKTICVSLSYYWVFLWFSYKSHTFVVES